MSGDLREEEAAAKGTGTKGKGIKGEDHRDGLASIDENADG